MGRSEASGSTGDKATRTVMEEEGAEAGRFLVVGVGASAGGLDAFKGLLSVVPPNSGMAFILVQHLDPTHKSLVAELLDKHVKFSVRQAEDDERIEPNHAYVIPPDAYLEIREGRLRVVPPQQQGGQRMSVDHFFRSLAEQCGRRAVGIVLSGTGRDGTGGLRAIKAGGGMTIAQEPSTASHSGMPQSAIDAGVADRVLRLQEIPEALARFASHPFVQVDEDAEEDDALIADSQETGMQAIGALLKSRAKFDITQYRPSTIQRRILRRMSLNGHRNLEQYLERLREEDGEAEELVRDLMIGVTEFFRDPAAFEILEKEMIPQILDRHTSLDVPVRVWTCGCATGEETYSLALLFAEAIEKHDRPVRLQVLATDVDEDALQYARSATYPLSIAGRMSEARLERFFTRIDNTGYRVVKHLRDTVSFATQNLISDPPFSKLDLISCRNVLIYLRKEVQEDIIKRFHFALKPRGILFLGSSEAVGGHSSFFSAVSRSHRIFRRLDTERPVSHRLPASRGGRGSGESGGSVGATAMSRASGSRERAEPPIDRVAQRAMINCCVPPAIVVDRAYSILYLHGDLSPYLDLPRGEPRMDLMRLLKPEIRTRVRAAIYKSIRDGESVTVQVTAGPSGTQIKVHPVDEASLGDGGAILTFSPIEDPAERAPMVAETDSVADELARELQATREDLRNTVEELETSNEELKASHEEAMSMNEELQSTNEELESTTEELRSLNEELHTVNTQLKSKIDQIETAHNDLQNFFSSTELATVFLTRQLRIKRFTPAARRLLDLREDDTDRLLTNVRSDLVRHGLQDEVTRVLDTLTPSESEIQTDDGRWYLRRILPYRTEDDRIVGAVVAMLDITRLKEITRRLEVRAAQQRAVAEFGQMAVASEGGHHDMDTMFGQAVRVVAQTLDTEFVKVLKLSADGRSMTLRAGVGWKDGLVGHATVDTGLDSQAGYTLKNESPVIVEDLRRERRFSGPRLLHDHKIVSGLSCVIKNGGVYGVLGAYTAAHRTFTKEDTDFLLSIANILGSVIHAETSRLQIEASEARATRAFSELASVYNGAPIGLCFVDRNLMFQNINEHLAAINGYTVEEHMGRCINDVLPEPLSREVLAQNRQVLETGEPITDLEVRGRTAAHDEQRWYLVSYYPVKGPSGEVIGVNTVVDDITDRKRAEARQEMLLAELSHRVKNMLATVSSMASQTMSQVDSMEAFRDAFFGRLRSITAVHGLLTGGGFEGADLRDIVIQNLSPYCADVDTRCDADGPAVRISASEAMALTMVFHELTTNAIKYGALSTSNGRISVQWSMETTTDEKVLMITWRESDGPAVTPPAATGFGSKLIEQEIEYGLEGSVSFDYQRDGLVCTIRFPLGDLRRRPTTDHDI